MLSHRTAPLLTAFVFGIVATWMVVAAAFVRVGEAKHLAGNPADGLAAWEQIYSVLTSPRCINCHTATNYPQQGDDRHRHFANVIRGPEGKGVPGLNCV